jgi:hypothetical protein
VLVDQKQILKSGEIWTANEVERNWVNQAKLASGADSALSTVPADQPPAAGAGRLTNTRWTVTAQDFAVLTQIDNKVRRSLLANALAEVGIYENGTDWEKQHLVSYGQAAGLPWSPQQRYPWGGAFTAWLLTQTFARPPSASVSYLSWRRWAEEKPSKSIEPGMVGIFKLDNAEVPQSGSRLLVGPIVRRQENCIEIIVGNIADRVVITCVDKDLFLIARSPDE